MKKPPKGITYICDRLKPVLDSVLGDIQTLYQARDQGSFQHDPVVNFFLDVITRAYSGAFTYYKLSVDLPSIPRFSPAVRVGFALTGRTSCLDALMLSWVLSGDKSLLDLRIKRVLTDQVEHLKKKGHLTAEAIERTFPYLIDSSGELQYKPMSGATKFFNGSDDKKLMEKVLNVYDAFSKYEHYGFMYDVLQSRVSDKVFYNMYMMSLVSMLINMKASLGGLTVLSSDIEGRSLIEDLLQDLEYS
jgi:hypothetical protein